MVKQLKSRIFLAVVLSALALLTLTAATLAWFTNNAQVGTSRVTGRTATEDVELQISSRGGDAFSGAQEAAITQVNETKLTYLMPVSTADLQTFVQCPATVDGYAVSFSKVENEQSYYHGRVYLRAVAEGVGEGAAVSLYLDESEAAGGALAVREDGESLLLNAARLGLVFGEDKENPMIFRLSDEENGTDKRARNTRLNGTVLEDGKVLTWEDAAKAVDDPSVLLSDHTVQQESGRLPAEPLFTMEVGRIYPVDIYFYLEGCDPDCTEAAAFDGGDLHLAFYGVLS